MKNLRRMGHLLDCHIVGGSRRRGAGAAAVDFDNHIEIRLPDWRVLRLVARSLLLGLAIVSLPWLGVVFGVSPSPTTVTIANENANDVMVEAAATTTAGGLSQSIDDVFFLPMLFRDLKRQGLIRMGDRAVLLTDSSPRLSPFLKQNKIDLITGRDDDLRRLILDHTVDFVFSDSSRDPDFIDRALKVGGVAAVRLSTNPATSFRMASNYKIVYVRRFESTIIAMKKIGHAQNTVTYSTGRRRLLMVPDARKEALNGLEGVFLEPPRASSLASGKKTSSDKYLKRTKYLPDLTGDTLEEYPRWVFVDVGSRGKRRSGGGAEWFARNYPTRNRYFEIIRVETEGPAERGTGDAAGSSGTEDEMSAWLRRNVREEEYVVMKAEAEVVEEMVNSRAIGLVDELFLECEHRGQKGRNRKLQSRRAYWECLALYGKLWDAGVAVHQWWG